MRVGRLGFAVVAALILATPGAAAPPVPWTPDGPMDGANDKGNTFPVRVVPRGAAARGLPMAARQISPSWEWQGRRWSLDAYMDAYNGSGVLVLKDGQVVLERYAQGRAPTDRWGAESVAKAGTSLRAG